jgi:rSAM/selenodomain-associated transferase 1
MPRIKKALILFAKSPKPGFVKTRFQPEWSAEEAGKLYQAFVMDLVSATSRLKSIARILACDPTSRDPLFQSLARRYKLKLMDQRGRNLGERMRNAIEEAHQMGFHQVVIIGTDSPTLPMEFIDQAFRLLRSHELVLGPSHDGGYYLIGCGEIIPPVFEGIPWGTVGVLALTLRRMVDLKLKCALLPFWYDVDTAQDLHLLSAHLDFLKEKTGKEAAPETASVLQNLKG